jgi:hypothetical protein
MKQMLRLGCAVAALRCAVARESKQAFHFETSPDRAQTGSWRVAGLPRRYFNELFPAIFERTLLIDQFQTRDGGLDWIFTGELGGFTIHADRSQIRVLQRYSDSFGFGDLAHPARDPEKMELVVAPGDIVTLSTEDLGRFDFTPEDMHAAR